MMSCLLFMCFDKVYTTLATKIATLRFHVATHNNKKSQQLIGRWSLMSTHLGRKQAYLWPGKKIAHSRVRTSYNKLCEELFLFFRPSSGLFLSKYGLRKDQQPIKLASHEFSSSIRLHYTRKRRRTLVQRFES